MPSITIDTTSGTWTSPLVKVQAGTVRYFAKHEWAQADISSRPAVQRVGEYSDHLNGHFSTFGLGWQFFAMDLASKIVFGKYHDELTRDQYRWLANRLTEVYGSTTAFCNGKGLTTHRNHLTGENGTADEPGIYTLICTGASLGGAEVGNMLKVAHFDATQPPPDVSTIDPYTDPRVFFATIIGKGASGYRVYRFDQLDGYDVPVPFIASRDVYYPLADLEKYVSDSKRSCYYP
ncbi:MAG: hypothetical protein EHM33_01050 [Chloroflexi bacterium]|nr:MAG: hypothetical protein EHM33_01050 [Chloroflexota bacterium]